MLTNSIYRIHKEHLEQMRHLSHKATEKALDQPPMSSKHSTDSVLGEVKGLHIPKHQQPLPHAEQKLNEELHHIKETPSHFDALAQASGQNVVHDERLNF